MASETYDLRFRETGIRVIKRKIDDLGQSANNATRGVFLLQRAIFVLGGFGAARALAGQVDMLTNLENRLQLTTNSTKELEGVQKELFRVARDSRSAFEGVAEIYTRTALSVKNLGISQKETIRFTESLAKASILSGASTREANAALIQLSQGLASNRLSGDELRSVLEQLPFVADVIAKSLGITRGELRQYGKEGKISAQVVLEAFRNSATEIDTLFAKTNVTLGQAFNVANTNMLEFIDRIDDATGASNKLGHAIIAISENMESFAYAIAAVGTAFAINFATGIIGSILSYAAGLKAAALQSTRLLEIESLRAAGNLRRVQARAAGNAARTIELTQRQALLGLKKADLQQTVLDTQFTVANNRARLISTGQFVNLASAKAALTRATTQLEIVETVEAATAARLTGARVAQAGATTALTGATTRLAGAQAAQATVTARLTQAFPLLAGTVRGVGVAFMALSGLLLANPIGLAITAVVGLTFAFIKWGDQIKLSEDGIVNLKNATVAAFQLMTEAIAPFAAAVRDGISGAFDFVKDVIAEFAPALGAAIVQGVKYFVDGMTFIPRVAYGVVLGVIELFQQLPGAAAAAGQDLANNLIDAFEAFANGAVAAVNKVISAINGLIGAVGGSKLGGMLGLDNLGKIGEIGKVQLDRFAGSGGKASAAFGEGFNKGFNTGTADDIIKKTSAALAPLATAISERARLNARIAGEDELMGQDVIQKTNEATPGGAADKDKGKGGSKGSGSKDKNFKDIIDGLNQEIQLLGLSRRERERANKILEIEKQLKRGLTEAEKELTVATLKSLEAAQTQSDVLQSIIGPREEIKEQQAALNELFRQGRIDIGDYTVAIREMQTAADEASGTLAGGFRASISGAIMSAQELGSALGGLVVGAADSAADAIVEFAKTGKLNIKSFFLDLFAQITKLIAKQLILKALGFVFGVPLGGSTGGGGGILGFSGGGSILPTGPGSTDSQVVSFAKRPDERVDILTPGQQNAQRNGNNNGGGTTVVQSPPVNVAALLSPSDIVGAFGNSEGETMVINILQKNASTVRRLVGG